MVTLLYHARANGAICKRIAASSKNEIRALCDKDGVPPIINGTLVRWDSKAEVEATRTVNTAEAVRLSRNKRRSRLVLAGICPPTWIVKRECQYPCVVRPRRHFGGNNFYLCTNRQELEAAVRRCGAGRWYASEFINKTAEFRVFVLNGEAFKVVKRYRSDADPTVPWNFHNGGLAKRLKQESWPEGLAELAEQAAERLRLDLCAVDVIADGRRMYVLEANTAPGLDREKTIKRFAELLGELA